MNTYPAYLLGLTIQHRPLKGGWAVIVGDSETVKFGGRPGYTEADAVQDRLDYAERERGNYPAHIVAQVEEQDVINNRVHAARAEIEAVEGEHSVFNDMLPPTTKIGFCLTLEGGYLLRCRVHKGPDARARAMEGLRDMWLRHRADERAMAAVEGAPALQAAE